MPDASRLVIVNTTPIIALSLLEHLDLLGLLYGEVIIPQAVWNEITAGKPGMPGLKELQMAAFIRKMVLHDPRRADLLSDLDRGEAEVIALAQETDADLVILDERLARRHAKRLNIPFTGVLGVLIRAKKQGLLDSVAPLLSKLRDRGIHLSDSVIKEALTLAGEKL
jgi:uncharacterized protein